MTTRTRTPARKATLKWTSTRRKAFLTELGATANVRAASRAAGMPDGSAYRLRDKDDAFRAAWVAALAEGYARVEMMLLERALNGTVKPVWHGGKKVGSVKEYSDRLALSLLAAHRGAVKGGAPALIETRGELADRLCGKLVQMGKRLHAAADAGRRRRVSGGTSSRSSARSSTTGRSGRGPSSSPPKASGGNG